MTLTEADIVAMDERARHVAEPWKPAAKELAQLREDNARLIAEVRQLWELWHGVKGEVTSNGT